MIDATQPNLLLKASTRLRQPRLSESVIGRARYEELLDNLTTDQLLLLQAPAGYGKSTLINHWCQSHKHPVLWYSLDDNDNCDTTFIHYVDQGMRNILELPEAPSAEPNPQQQLIALLNALPEQHEKIIMVLDDYHHIDSPGIHALVRFLCQHQPDYLQIVVISRTIPQIGIPELRAKGRLQALYSEDLAFDADETVSFLASHLQFEASREQCERLNRRTEGWASALKLACQAGQTFTQLDDFIEQLQTGHHHIIDYLAEEVVEPLSEPLKDFLYQTSILDTFDIELAVQVTQQPDAAAQVSELTAQGLFIETLERNEYGSVYRYHRLLANCLQQLLVQRKPNDIHPLHQRASNAWLKREKPSLAAQHALKARDENLIRAILLRYGRQLYRDSQLRTLHRCLQQLNQDSISRQPLLTLLSAWVAQGQHRFEAAEEWLTKAEKELQPIYGKEEWRSLQGEFFAVRAQIAMNLGNTDEAINFANYALEQQPEHMRTSRTTALSVLGEVDFVRGNLDNALQQMEETEQIARSHNASRLVLWTISQQSEIAMARGLLQKSYNLQQKAISYAEENHLPPSTMMEFIYRIRGQILWEWHQLEEAEKSALKGLEVLEGHGERWRLQCYTLLAKVALAQSKQHLCADYIKRIQQMLASWDYHDDWVANAHATLISYWEEVRDLDTMNHWLSIAPERPEATNHFSQCTQRNRARVLIALERYDEAENVLLTNSDYAQKLGLTLDQSRNHIYLSHLYWQQEKREDALHQLHQALQLATNSGLLGSFLRIGKPLIVMLKALQREETLDELTSQRAERLINLSHQRRNFSKAIRITLDEAIIQDIINRPDIPELIRTSPLTRREWQVLSLIHAGLSNEQIASHLNVAPTTIKTHIRSLYQKVNVTNRNEAIALASDLLAKIQGE